MTLDVEKWHDVSKPGVRLTDQPQTSSAASYAQDSAVYTKTTAPLQYMGYTETKQATWENICTDKQARNSDSNTVG